MTQNIRELAFSFSRGSVCFSGLNIEVFVWTRFSCGTLHEELKMHNAKGVSRRLVTCDLATYARLIHTNKVKHLHWANVYNDVYTYCTANLIYHNTQRQVLPLLIKNEQELLFRMESDPKHLSEVWTFFWWIDVLSAENTIRLPAWNFISQ